MKFCILIGFENLHLLQTPPPLCDFEQWIDTEIKEADMRLLQGLKEWDAERLEILEKRRREEAAAKEHKEEEKMRHVAACREDREKKLERVHRVKAAMEDNPDAQEKRESGLVVLSSMLVIWFNHK
jgi:hypothetical protein